MNIDNAKIHLVDVKQKSYYNLDELKEEMILYIIQPNKPTLELILESYFLLTNFSYKAI